MTQSIVQNNAAVAIFDSPAGAEAAVRKLHGSLFDMNKLSVVGKDTRPEKQVVGYFKNGDQLKYWGALGAFWGGLWVLLSGWAFFSIPEIGPVLAAGPVTGWIVAALENAAIFGGLSSLGAALYSIGIPKGSVRKLEEALKSGKYLVIAHGTAEEVHKVENILQLADAVGAL